MASNGIRRQSVLLKPPRTMGNLTLRIQGLPVSCFFYRSQPDSKCLEVVTRR